MKLNHGVFSLLILFYSNQPLCSMMGWSNWEWELQIPCLILTALFLHVYTLFSKRNAHFPNRFSW